ncbi:TM2 domain-containing protein [Psychromicrobium lacuslunae]|uniref:TM2 domain-containing protein n=1 Tax=Psychromicrobium lacuslunae TaxID=1618207 RepID=UPI0005D39EAB|nr:TM2 domain-containing protein [Psychromicrobium lacuslunae]
MSENPNQPEKPSADQTPSFEQAAAGGEPTFSSPSDTPPAVNYPDQNYPDQASSQQAGYQQQNYQQGYPGGVVPKSKIAAGLLGIFLGSLGIHNFYLGFTGKAVAQLLISLLSLGILAPLVAIWGLIEGILILVGSSGFQADAKGVPLRD